MFMPIWLMILIAYALLGGIWWLLIVPWLRQGPGGNASVGLIWRLTKAFLRIWHRPTFVGRDHLANLAQGPVIVVANHTGAIDPFLIQSATNRLIHFMMARDMMVTGCDDLWSLVGVIPVDRTHMDTRAVRSALRHLRDGHVVGIFPEGHITRPPGTLRPFSEGVGLLAGRTGATIVPCWISETPDVDRVAGSLLRRSRSQVVFLEPIRYEPDTPPAQIAQSLRTTLADVSGWPCQETIMPGPESSSP